MLCERHYMKLIDYIILEVHMIQPFLGMFSISHLLVFVNILQLQFQHQKLLVVIGHLLLLRIYLLLLVVCILIHQMCVWIIVMIVLTEYLSAVIRIVRKLLL